MIPFLSFRVKFIYKLHCINIRERVKIFNEGLSVFNKCFPGIPSRKRSRSDVLSVDRSSVLFSSDRSVIGPTVGKMGALSHTTASGLELDQQKQEEKTKNLIPNKRTRTSIADPRVCILILMYIFIYYPWIHAS